MINSLLLGATRCIYDLLEQLLLVTLVNVGQVDHGESFSLRHAPNPNGLVHILLHLLQRLQIYLHYFAIELLFALDVSPRIIADSGIRTLSR